MRRVFTIRMTVQTGAEGKDPYYGDEELLDMIRIWFDAALEDRGDAPEILRFEGTQTESER